MVIGIEIILCRVGMLTLEIGEISRPFLTGQSNGKGSFRVNRVEIMFGVLMGSRTCFCIQSL
jgi:hypothetical protein